MSKKTTTALITVVWMAASGQAVPATIPTSRASIEALLGDTASQVSNADYTLYFVGGPGFRNLPVNPAAYDTARRLGLIPSPTRFPELRGAVVLAGRCPPPPRSRTRPGWTPPRSTQPWPHTPAETTPTPAPPPPHGGGAALILAAHPQALAGPLSAPRARSRPPQGAPVPP